VKQNGGSIQYAANELKRDKEIVMRAIKNRYLFSVDESLKRDNWRNMGTGDRKHIRNRNSPESNYTPKSYTLA